MSEHSSSPYFASPAGSADGSGTDIIGTSQPGDPGSAESPPNPPRRRGGIVVLGAALAVALVAGGSAVAYSQLAGGGTQPESLVPSTAVAFVKIDLDPSAKEKVDILRFARTFPSAAKQVSADADDARDGLLRPLFSDSELLDYDTDVRPWLGDRVGVAALPATGSDEEPDGLLVVQYTDETKARAALAKAARADVADGADASGFVLRDGYAMIGETQAKVDAADRAARKDNLASNDRYRDDIGLLPGDRVLTGWADLVALGRTAQGLAGSLTGVGPLAGATPGAQGRVVVSASVEPTYLEVQGRLLGTDRTGTAKPARQLITSLPSSTVAAVSASDAGAAVATQLDALTTGPAGDLLEGVQQGTGLDLRRDLPALLGKHVVIALGDVPSLEGGKLPSVGLRTTSGDPAAAEAVADTLIGLGQRAGVTVEKRRAAADVVLSVGDGYADRLAVDGDLGSGARFRTALPDIDDAGSAVWVDLARLAELGPDSEDLKHLDALGITVGRDGDSDVVRMRLIVR